jgi:perosamine synthetase
MKEQRSNCLPVAEPDLGPLEENYILDALRSKWVSSIGSYIQRFESGFAEFCGVRNGVAVSNGTVALHLALVAGGIGPGDEVIVPALTFVATAAAVRHAGAVPVFVDVEPEIGTIDPEAVANAVGSRTKAIIPVHLYGHPADMHPILEIAKDRNILVIEDAAEAHGANYKQDRVGGLGHLATFSFYGNKILTTGEGGMVVTNDDTLARRLRFLKDHAMDPDRRYWHQEVGYNYRMTNLQAAMGCAQLERYAELIAKKRRVVDMYRRAFQGSGVAINPTRAWASAAPWLVCAVLPSSRNYELRAHVIDELKNALIDSRPYFHLASSMPPYKDCRIVGKEGANLHVSEDLSMRGLNLPSMGWLDERDVAAISGTVLKSVASAQLGQANN